MRYKIKTRQRNCGINFPLKISYTAIENIYTAIENFVTVFSIVICHTLKLLISQSLDDEKKNHKTIISIIYWTWWLCFFPGAVLVNTVRNRQNLYTTFSFLGKTGVIPRLQTFFYTAIAGYPWLLEFDYRTESNTNRTFTSFSW